MKILRLRSGFSADHSESDYQYVTWEPREDVDGRTTLKVKDRAAQVLFEKTDERAALLVGACGRHSLRDQPSIDPTYSRRGGGTARVFCPPGRMSGDDSASEAVGGGWGMVYEGHAHADSVPGTEGETGRARAPVSRNGHPRGLCAEFLDEGYSPA